MAFIDKLKNAMGIGDEDEDLEEEEEELEKEPVRESRYERKEPVKREEPKPAPVQEARPSSRIDSVKTEVTRQTMGGKYTSQMKMIVIEPQGFEESPKLVDSLKAKKPIIINLENLETDVARKIFDFLSGATYALNGNVQKVANNIFVFAPENVDVTYKDSSKQAPAESSSKSPWA